MTHLTFNIDLGRFKVYLFSVGGKTQNKHNYVTTPVDLLACTGNENGNLRENQPVLGQIKVSSGSSAVQSARVLWESAAGGG